MSDYLKQVWLGTRLSPGTDALGRLLGVFKTAEAVYAADADAIASAMGNRRAEAKSLLNRDLGDAERVLEYCATVGVRLLTYFDPDYPACLRRLPDPPPWLFVKGELPDFERLPVVSVVGTRDPSDYGKRLTHEIAYDLASAGVLTVSGLALGIDGIAAAASLSAGGRTVALLGSGIDIVYPSAHSYLMREIVKRGCIITEFAPGVRPERWNFPRRNRLISALADAVLVTCGSLYSGSLITARHAIEQGRTVYALPGPVDTPDGEGPMRLLRDGCKAASCADDILSALEDRYPSGIDVFRLKETPSVSLEDSVERYRVRCKGDDRTPRVRFPSLRGQKEKKEEATVIRTERLTDLTPDEEAVLSALPDGDFIPDEVNCPGIAIGDLCATLTLLEIRGLLRTLPGGRYRRIR